MIKKHGGIFGRNPTFNNVTVDGTLAINGPITIGGDVFSGLDYDGTWNASTNTPTLTSSVGTIGHFYIVSVAGSTDLDGITNWGIGDWAVFNGSAWQRVEGGADGNFAELSVTGTSQFADGLAASPSITNIGDTNTGLYFPSADAIAIVTGGVNRLRVTSAGDIGIGTTSPTSKLDVNGTVTATGATVTGNTYLATTSGNVGIGTSSPASLLHINANNAEMRFSEVGTYYASLKVDSAGGLTIGADPGNTAANSRLIFAIDNTERMRIDSSGNVGIGTSSPNTKLQVLASNTTSRTSFAADAATFVGTGINIASGTTETGIYFADNSYISKAAIRSDASRNLIFDTANTERMRITSTGNLGIGTSSPGAKLSVDGSAIFNDSGADVDFRVEGDTDANLLFLDASADTAFIGTTTNTNSSKLVVNGTISETVSSTQYLIASQYDVGTAPNELPLVQYLGTAAFASIPSVALISGGSIQAGTGTICKTSLFNNDGVKQITSIMDLTGLYSPASGDIIGKDASTLPAYIFQIPAGMTVLGGRMTCLETPAGGEDDIDLYSATEGTGVEDTAISTLTETQIINAGAQTAGTVTYFAADPAASSYLYLVSADATAGTYTAGRFLIEIFGV